MPDINLNPDYYQDEGERLVEIHGQLNPPGSLLVIKTDCMPPKIYPGKFEVNRILARGFHVL